MILVWFNLTFLDGTSQLRQIYVHPLGCHWVYLSQTDVRQADQSFLALLAKAIGLPSLIPAGVLPAGPQPSVLPGSTTVFTKLAGRPAGLLPNSQIVDPPTFLQDTTDGCNGSSTDFDMTPKTDPNPYSGKAQYRVLTINIGGTKCDHLSWDIYQTVPQAAMNTCRFFMHFAGIDYNTGLSFRFLDNHNNVITTLPDLVAPPIDEDTDVKGVRVVQADLSKASPETPIDVGILFVNCNSTDLGVPHP